MEGLEWRKTRFCANTSCVEVAFHKSTRCSDTASCVEMGYATGVVYVRDSKAGNDGTVLAFTRPAWRVFLANLPARGDAG